MQNKSLQSAAYKLRCHSDVLETGTKRLVHIPGILALQLSSSASSSDCTSPHRHGHNHRHMHRSSCPDRSCFKPSSILLKTAMRNRGMCMHRRQEKAARKAAKEAERQARVEVKLAAKHEERAQRAELRKQRQEAAKARRVRALTTRFMVQFVHQQMRVCCNDAATGATRAPSADVIGLSHSSGGAGRAELLRTVGFGSAIAARVTSRIFDWRPRVTWATFFTCVPCFDTVLGAGEAGGIREAEGGQGGSVR
jgi:hypothetical protein